MQRFLKHAILLSVFFSFLIGACTLPALHRPDLGISIYHPDSGMIMPLGGRVSIKARVNIGSSVDRVVFVANGRNIGEVAGPAVGSDGSLDTTLVWSPPAPGEFQLQAMALLSGGGGDTSEPVRICVLDPALFTGFSAYGFSPAGSHGYTGPCLIPAPHPFDPSVSPTAPVYLDAQTYPNPTVLVFSPASGCPYPTGATGLVIFAELDDPADRVIFVIVHVSTGDGTVADTFNLAPPTGLRPIGGSVTWGGASDDLGSQLRDYASAHPWLTSITLLWTAYAVGRDGSILAHSGPHTVSSIPCGPTPLSAPFSFSTPTLTVTPASARDCPSGTFFAEQTHQCLSIQIQPTKKPNACSKYDNASACTSNGCSWDKPSSSCH